MVVDFGSSPPSSYRSLMPNYVSMIKINGRPILPPLMTPEIRADCQKWREMAVKKEKQRLTNKDKTLRISSGIAFTNSTNVATGIPQSRSGDANVDEVTSTAGSGVENFDDGAPGDEESKEDLPEKSEPTEVPSTSSTLIRSESFTLETPSAALADRLARLDEPPSPVNSQTLSVTVSATALSASPVIADPRVHPILSASSRQLFPPPADPNVSLEQIQDMKRLLSDYHRLQLEELTLRQEEESKRLMMQEESLKNLVPQSSADQSTVPKQPNFEVGSSDSDDATSSTAPVTPLPFDATSAFPEHLSARLVASVKGYFTRRLYKCRHVQELRKTAKDLTEQMDLDESSPGNQANSDFRLMLTNQLRNIRREIYDIFLSYSFSQQTSLSKESESYTSPKARATKRLSLATQRYQTRKSAIGLATSSRQTTPRRAAKPTSKLSVNKSNKIHRRTMSVAPSPRRSLNRRVADRTFTVSTTVPKRSSSSIAVPLNPPVTSASTAAKSRSSQQLKRPWR
uniref:Uncharacterized protein n=1 Tax=Plectus sambesii TaxID=2011161 RepID=A0A914VM89_9BILA